MPWRLRASRPAVLPALHAKALRHASPAAPTPSRRPPAARRKGQERTQWCRAHFINPRAMRKATDIHAQVQGRPGVWVWFAATAPALPCPLVSNLHPIALAPPSLPQLKEHLQGLGIDPLKTCGDDSLPLRRALVAGLFPHAAKRQLDGAWCTMVGPPGPRGGLAGACTLPWACLFPSTLGDLLLCQSWYRGSPLPAQARTRSSPRGRQCTSTPPLCCMARRPGASCSTSWCAPLPTTLICPTH